VGVSTPLDIEGKKICPAAPAWSARESCASACANPRVEVAVAVDAVQVCAWCGKRMAGEVEPPPKDETHTICDACLEQKYPGRPPKREAL
jgi:hypothetical protein